MPWSRRRGASAVHPQPEPNGTTLKPLVTVPSACTSGVTDQDGQPACPICLDDLVEPQMLGCGHVYCAKCIATHASVQLAANRPVNCPCCLRPVAPTELPTEVHVEAAERKTAASSSTVEAPAGAWRLGQRSRFSRAAARLKARCCRCDLSWLDAAAFAMAVADVLCMVPSLL